MVTSKTKTKRNRRPQKGQQDVFLFFLKNPNRPLSTIEINRELGYRRDDIQNTRNKLKKLVNASLLIKSQKTRCYQLPKNYKSEEYVMRISEHFQFQKESKDVDDFIQKFMAIPINLEAQQRCITKMFAEQMLRRYGKTESKKAMRHKLLLRDLEVFSLQCNDALMRYAEAILLCRLVEKYPNLKDTLREELAQADEASLIRIITTRMTLQFQPWIKNLAELPKSFRAMTAYFVNLTWLSLVDASGSDIEGVIKERTKEIVHLRRQLEISKLPMTNEIDIWDTIGASAPSSGKQ